MSFIQSLMFSANMVASSPFSICFWFACLASLSACLRMSRILDAREKPCVVVKLKLNKSLNCVCDIMFFVFYRLVLIVSPSSTTKEIEFFLAMRLASLKAFALPCTCSMNWSNAKISKIPAKFEFLTILIMVIIL